MKAAAGSVKPSGGNALFEKLYLGISAHVGGNVFTFTHNADEVSPEVFKRIDPLERQGFCSDDPATAVACRKPSRHRDFLTSVCP